MISPGREGLATVTETIESVADGAVWHRVRLAQAAHEDDDVTRVQ